MRWPNRIDEHAVTAHRFECRQGSCG
jgi:hypothetical protein